MAQVQKVAVPVPVPAPRHFQWPWRQIVIAVAILMTVVAVVYGVSEFVSRVGDATAPAVAQPAAQPFDAAQGKPVQQAPQNVQENVGGTTPKVVDYRGNPWNPTKDFDPFTIPVEKGLYDGTMQNMPWGSTERPEARAYALKVYPELKDAGDNPAILAAIARDAVDKDVVLLSVFVSYTDKAPGERSFKVAARIALSVDGEKSWCNLDLLPADLGSEAGDVRVVTSNGLIHLYGQDNRPGYFWWEKVATRSELPCS